jgi:hypothetical protein
MFMISMFRVGGWKAVVGFMVLGLVFKLVLYSYIFPQTSAMMLAAQPDIRARHAFGLGLATGGRAPDAEAPPPAERGFVPAPAWVSYAEDDPSTGARVFHARLTAEASQPAAGAAAEDPSRLELQQGPHQAGLVMLTLGGVPAADCASITAVDAKFDSHTAHDFAATAQPQGGSCAVAITDYKGFHNAVRYADTLFITPTTAAGHLAPTKWHVAGLSWGGD